jgi:L-lactate dehydrogenase complex protein LldG
MTERFVRELGRVNGSVRRVREDELTEAVRRAAEDLAAGSAVVAPDLDDLGPAVGDGLRRAGVRVARPEGSAWREQAAEADLGVTSAVLGVASTGSVLIEAGERSPRTASLLPGAHLVVMPASRLVPGMEEALERADRSVRDRTAVVLVTGPSRTADIEMQIVYGVHGPRSLTVLLVEA